MISGHHSSLQQRKICPPKNICSDNQLIYVCCSLCSEMKNVFSQNHIQGQRPYCVLSPILMPMTIKQMIKHLNKQDQAYILANKNMVQDILEQQLDHEEIDALLATAHFVEAQKKKQQITMKLSQSTLEAIKLKAKQEWLPYQTLIGSILHKYTTGQLSA